MEILRTSRVVVLNRLIDWNFEAVCVAVVVVIVVVVLCYGEVID